MKTDGTLRQIAKKTADLREFTRATGTATTRSQGELLRGLDAEEMAKVAEFFNEDGGRTNGPYTSK